MQMDFLQALMSLPRDTQILIAVIAGLTLYFHARFTPQAAANGPTILTTTGIFATFVGISLGLSAFDTSNVQASVPALLSGLKTAFWASVVGVGGALTLKFREYCTASRPAEGTETPHQEVTAAHLAALLSNIHKALVGADDGSLICQIKLARQDANDRLDVLKDAQQQALARLSEMGSKALVEALRDVIRDFNAKIGEQFGDNFKQLNEGVGELLVWQQQYRDHVDQTSNQLSRVAEASEKMTSDFLEVVSQAEHFAKVASDLQSVLAGIEAEKRQLTDTAGDLGRLLKAAEGSIPNVERKVVELAEQLSRSVSQQQKIIGDAMAQNAASINATVTAAAELIAEASAQTKEQVGVLEQALSDALQQSLNSLGQQLTALSEAFVEDYAPLTQKLRQIVQLAS
jgi:uncharacterized phage infection (PIP) family protein YhgE